MILTNFLNRIQFRKSENFSNSFLLAQKNFFLYEEFKQRLSLEKRRAERLNSPLSIILSKLEFDKKSNRLLFCGIDGNSLIEIILSKVRETDIVSLHDFKEVLVLLPETNIKQAQLVMNGVIKKIQKKQFDNCQEEKMIVDNFQIIDARDFTMGKRRSLNKSIKHQASSIS